MPVLSRRIRAEGALVRVEVGWSAAAGRRLRLALQPVPPPVQVLALVDTGAEGSCVATAVVTNLGLPTGGFTVTGLPAVSGLTFGMMHDVSLTVLHLSGDPSRNLVVPDLLVTELPHLTGLGYDAVVGRDVLARCRLLYDGPAGRFRVAY